MTTVLHGLERTVARVEPATRWISGIGILVLMAMTAIDVALRTFSGRGVAGTIEYAEVILAIVVYLAMTTAGRDGHHIRVTLLTSRLPRGAARVLRGVGLVVSIGIVSWVTVNTTILAIHSIQTGEYRFGLVSVPIWPARLAIPIGLVLLLVVLVTQFVAQIIGRETIVGRESEPYEEMIESAEGPDHVER